MTSVVRYRPALAPHFARLNYEWIEHYFAVEAEDVRALEHPEDYAINPGGEIFFVTDAQEVVGTVAMVPKGDGVFELAKMAVAPSHQGRGLANLLMDACIDFARKQKAKRVVLTTNSMLTPAVTLYERAGFVADPVNEDPRYERGNLAMTLYL